MASISNNGTVQKSKVMPHLLPIYPPLVSGRANTSHMSNGCPCKDPGQHRAVSSQETTTPPDPLQADQTRGEELSYCRPLPVPRDRRGYLIIVHVGTEQTSHCRCNLGLRWDRPVVQTRPETIFKVEPSKITCLQWCHDVTVASSVNRGNCLLPSMTLCHKW